MSSIVQNQEDRVTELLTGFTVINNPVLQFLVKRGPLFIALFLLIDALVGQRLFTRDFFRSSSVLTAIIEIVLFGALFAKVPDVLRAIWTRRLIHESVDGEPVSQSFAQFLTEFAADLNHKYAWALGGVLALIGFFATYQVRAWFTYCSSDELVNLYRTFCAEQFTFGKWLSYYLWGNWGLAGPLISLFIGLLVWRAGVIALYMTRLSKRFSLNIQFKHPDGIGGYRPFGDLCLLNALLIVLPATYFSIWSLLPYIGGIPDNIVIGFQELWSDLFRSLLVILLNVAAIWAFFGPVYGVHIQMKRRRDETLGLLDDIGAGELEDEANAAISDWQSRLNQKRFQLRQEMVEAFNEEELKTLCFDLGVDYENVAGDTKAEKTREIISLFERKDRLKNLVLQCRRMRPEVDWPDVTDLEQASRVVNMLPAPEETIESGYQTLNKAPIWPFTNGVLLSAVSIQAIILAGLVGSIVATG